MQNRFFINFLEEGHLDIMVVPEMANLWLFRLCVRAFFDNTQLSTSADP